MSEQKLSPADVSVDDRVYVRAHGKAPRGRGNWAFIDERLVNREDYLSHVMWHNGSYTEGKVMAKKYFAIKGVANVAVLS